MQTQDEQNDADAAFAVRALSLLADEPVSSDLTARILDDFDRVATAQPALGLRLAHRLRALGDLLWPGAPLWQPASVLAFSLILGLAAGLLLPSSALAAGDATQLASASVSLETPPSLDLSGKEL